MGHSRGSSRQRLFCFFFSSPEKRRYPFKASHSGRGGTVYCDGEGILWICVSKPIILTVGTSVPTKLTGGRNPSPAKIPAGASPRPTKEVKSAWQNDIILFIMYCLLLLKITIGQPRTSVPTKLTGGRNPSPAKISAGTVPGRNYKLLPALAIDSPPGCQCGYAAASRPRHTN